MRAFRSDANPMAPRSEALKFAVPTSLTASAITECEIMRYVPVAAPAASPTLATIRRLLVAAELGSEDYFSSPGKTARTKPSGCDPLRSSSEPDHPCSRSLFAALGLCARHKKVPLLHPASRCQPNNSPTKCGKNIVVAWTCRASRKSERFPDPLRIWVDIRKGVSQREVFAGLETPAVGAKPIWARGNARHHADLQSLAYNAAQWGTHIRRRNRKCSDGAAAVLRSLAAAICASAT